MASIATTNRSSYSGLIVAFTIFLLSGIFLKSIYEIPIGSTIYYILFFGFLSPYTSFLSPETLTINIKETLFVGILMIILCSLLYYGSVRFVKAQNISVISLVRPVAVIFLGYLILHEQLFSYTFEVCACILTGTGVVLMGAKSNISFNENVIFRYMKWEYCLSEYQQSLLHTFYRTLCKEPLQDLKR